MKSFRPYAIAIVLFLIWLSCQSCGSAKYVETTPQYYFVNNQIVMLK